MHLFKGLFHPQWQQYFSIAVGVSLLIIGLLYFLPQAGMHLKLPWTGLVTKGLGKVMHRRHPGWLAAAGALNGLLPCGMFDKLPFKGKFWDRLMDVTTIKVGHMEVNYGDAHFRRSDGGQTLYNPFMESYIMDAFATEIGGEVTVQQHGLFGMIAVTNGMIKGNVDSTTAGVVNGDIIDGNTNRSPSIILKGGIDKQLTPQLRARASASYYHNSSSAGSGLTLYGGDRAGSNYQNVVEKWKDGAGATMSSTSIAFSGRLNPGFSKKIDAVMLNGFVKYGGLEVFATYEFSKGRNKTEKEERNARRSIYM